MKRWLLASAALAAVLAPLAAAHRAPSTAADVPFPGWPATFEGRSLKALPLTEREATLAEGFPGRVGRFSDGRREVILRWVTRPTRRLHPVAHCYEAHGWTIDERKVTSDGWAELTVRKDGTVQRVREVIRDGGGGRFTDVSSWYWAAVFGRTPGPWWSVAVAETSSEIRDGVP